MAETVDDYVKALSNTANPTQNATPYWPDQSDLDLSKKYDTTYGSSHAPYTQPDSAYVRTTPQDQATAWYSKGAMMPPANLISGNLSTQVDADRARAQHIAAERSAMAKLGWDPGLNITSKNKDPGPNGFFQPESDVSWNTEALPSTAIHEAMHRSMARLREGNKLPKGVERGASEEAYVRALMQRAYGSVELKHELDAFGGKPDKSKPGYQQQIQGRQMMNDKIVDQLEALAAEEIARKHPRGPR